MRDCIVVWEESGQPYIKTVFRNEFLDKTGKVNEAKRIAAQIIECQYVDGMNLHIGNQYYGGIYCDDLATVSYPYRFHINGNACHGPIVVINEVGGLSRYDAKVIVQWLQDNSTRLSR